MKTKQAAKHTPGPWAKQYGCIIGPDGKTLGHASGRSVEEAEANINLAKSAPELLEAARMALKEMIAQADVRGNGNHTENYVVSIKLLEAAIAKAEGR